MLYKLYQFFLSVIDKILSMILEPVIGYSRMVSFTKVLLLGIAFILCTVLIVLPLIKPVHEQFNLTFSEVNSDDANKPKMVNPRLQGVDSDGQPFNVISQVAVQEDNNRVILEGIDADVTLKDGMWIAALSDQGVLDLANKTISLNGNVNLFTDSGIEFRTTDAFIDMEKDYAFGNNKVEGQGSFGTLEASGFKVDKHGELIVFNGRVKLVIYPEE